MSAQVDISRAIRSWLREEDHDTADEVLEVVLSQLATTPQRRRFWQAGRPSAPWTMIRVIAVAVAVLIAVVTYSLLPGLRVGPGATPSVVPTLIARGSFVEHDWGQVDFEATRVGASVTGRMTIAAREDVGAVTIDFECARERCLAGVVEHGRQPDARNSGPSCASFFGWSRESRRSRCRVGRK